MALWADLITPVEATAEARVELEEYERSRGSLTRWLPNIPTEGDSVEIFEGDNGLVPEAHFRAWNAPPEIGSPEGLSSTLVKLVAISRNEPIDEATQRALRRLPEGRIRRSVNSAIRRGVWATSDALERTRGGIFQTGVVANPWQKNFRLNEDFGRDAALTVDAGTGNYWDDADADRIGQMQDWIAVWKSFNRGAEPGAVVFSDRSFSGLLRGAQFATLLPNGASRPASQDEVMSVAQAHGFAAFEKYNRSTASGPVLDPKYIFIVPQPAAEGSEEPTLLGGTYYGETVTAEANGFEAVAEDDPRGLVAGVYREDRIPYTVEAMTDAVALPVAHNPNAVMAVKVFA